MNGFGAYSRFKTNPVDLVQDFFSLNASLARDADGTTGASVMFLADGGTKSGESSPLLVSPGAGDLSPWQRAGCVPRIIGSPRLRR